MPGAPLLEVIGQIERERNGMKATDNDFLVMVGGSNLISEGSIEELDDKLDRLAGGSGNFLWVETPMRFDRTTENGLIKKQNSVIKKACIKHKWSFLSINTILDRTCYTNHGLHLNRIGKIILCDLISNFFLSMDIAKQPVEQQKNLAGPLPLEKT